MKPYVIGVAFRVLSKFNHDPEQSRILSQMADEMRTVNRLARERRHARPSK